MLAMKGRVFFILFLCIISVLMLPFGAESQQGHKSKDGSGLTTPSEAEQKPVYTAMPGPGKKVQVGDEYYFTYGFDKKPKLGIVILKVELFTKGGKKETSFEVKADAGMPSMRGHHDTGDLLLKLSKNGDYLLPVSIVMRGDWEIKLTFLKDGKVIYRGSYQFDV